MVKYKIETDGEQFFAVAYLEDGGYDCIGVFTTRHAAAQAIMVAKKKYLD
jgi:hypothetical protein